MGLFSRKKEDHSNWQLKDFVNFMEENKKSVGKNSPEFEAVRIELQAVCNVQTKQINETTAREMVMANDRLMKACKTYIETRKGAITSNGKDRLDVIGDLLEHQNSKNLDEMRDVRKVREYEGKTWEQAGTIKLPTIELTGKEKQVGANVSTRFMVEHDGKKGFFTEETTALNMPDLVEKRLNEIQDEKLKGLIEKNKEVLSEYKCEGNRIDLEWTKIYLTQKSMNDKYKSNLEELLADPKAVAWSSKLLKEGETYLTARLNTGSQLNDNTEKTRIYAEIELTRRNIATSRMAELLGVGNVVAHSEKMVVKQGDTVKTGCFMEFAEGIDIASDRGTDGYLAEHAKVDFNASFNRDQSNIEVLDFICSQNDRHGKNMFYKLGEMDDDGKRPVIGIQGIDNDLAFGTQDNYNPGWQGGIKDLYFIDKDLAEKVKKLNRKDLEYAVGDLLSDREIDALEKRVTELKQNMKAQMVEIDPDKWDLNEYSPESQPTDERGKNYVAGLNKLKTEFDATLNDKTTLRVSHKVTAISNEMKLHNKRAQQADKEESYNLQGMQDLFAEAEGKEAKRMNLKDVENELKAEKEVRNKSWSDYRERKKERELESAAKAKKPENQEKESAKEGPEQKKPERRVTIGRH